MNLEFLPPSVSTLYAEILQQLITMEAQRAIADLKGTFVVKQIKGKNYWYLQYSEGGKQKQVYLGNENDELLKIIQEHQEGKKLKADDYQNRDRLCSMLRKGGAVSPDPLTGRILKLLADGGIFRLGGVLVGTHAFLTYANMLGVKWPHSLKTQDIDLAQELTISVALARESVLMDLEGVLDRAQMGFHPIPSLNPKYPSTSFKLRGKEIHVDLLTPLIGREKEKPIQLPALNFAAWPLRFLDYLIEETNQAAVIYENGILVNVPLPARFALHKLLVSGRRSPSQQTKAKKDREQAAFLLEVLLKDRPGDLKEAGENLIKRGKGWQMAMTKGFNQLKTTHKELAQQCLSHFS